MFEAKHACARAFGIPAFLLLAAAAPMLHAAVPRIFDINLSSPVAEAGFVLASSSTPHVIELRNLSAAADPIVYLLNNTGTQVGSASVNNGALSLSVPKNLSGTFLLVVRSRSATTPQTADLYIDQQLKTANLSFTSGFPVTMSQVASDEKIMGVPQPLGPMSHAGYLFTLDGRTLLRRMISNHTTLSPPSKQDVLAVYAGNGVTGSGPIRVYRNDAGHDTDGDGLGDELEAALGTCASKSGSVAGVDCSAIADPRDTDGDGLQDGWEVLGKDYSYKVGNITVTRYLALPRMGSNPRHKDIFVEVDFRRLTLADNQAGLSIHMTPDVARKMAAIYADAATTDGVSQLVHAVSAQNPDRLTGISLHLDIGTPPQTPADATIYGDWGGFNGVDAILDPNHPGDYIAQDPGQVWQQQLAEGRTGIFHYVMGYTSGGGACAEGIACGFNMASPQNSAHEFGHTIGLNHNGPYTVTDEPNCKPNYPSLMNYAYYGTGYSQFSDGRNFPNFNNHALVETNAVDPSNTPLITALQSYFGYKVDTTNGSVDWNRDGAFAPASQPVRAYANYQPGGECEFTRERSQTTPLKSMKSPAIVRFGGNVWIFTIDLGGKLAFTYPPSFTCSQSNIDSCSGLPFQVNGTRDLGALAAFDAKTMLVNGMEFVFFVCIRPDGTMFETTLSVQDGRQVWGSVTPIATSPAAGEPSLANNLERTGLALAYKGTDNIVRIRYRSATGWGAEQQLATGGQPIVVTPNSSPAVAYVGLPLGGVTAIGEHILLAAADGQGLIQFYTPTFPLNRWGRISLPYDSFRSTVGRPVMAWTGGTPGVVVAGGSAAVTVPFSTYPRLYLLYLQFQAPPPTVTSPINPMRMAMSYVDPTGHLRIGLDADFDDEWAYAYGMSVITPTDSALRAALTSAVIPGGSPPLNQVFFRPHADGINDLVYHNYDDWKTLAHDSCTVLTAHQADSPVKCAAVW